MRKPESGRIPGRPKNTSRHQTNDAILLLKITDRKLENPHQPLSTIIKNLIDERDKGGIRRLQSAFKVQCDSLMVAATQRRYQRQLREPYEKLEAFTGGVQIVALTVAEKLDVWMRSSEGQRATEGLKRFEQAMNTSEVRKTIATLSRPILQHRAGSMVDLRPPQGM